MLNVSRLFALLIFGTFAVSGNFLRNHFAPVEWSPSDRPAHMPALTKIHVPPDELRELVQALVRTESWWNSLAFAHIEYHATVTKSEHRYKRDIEDMKASFPAIAVDEDAFPELARVWDVKRLITFDESQLIWSDRSNYAYALQTERWDGESLTGYCEYNTKQEPNYYLKADVSDLTSPLVWFPRIGTPLLVLTGVAATVVVGWLASAPGSTFSVEIAVAVGAFFLGAVVRDFRFARRAARLWKPQLHFIDWRKVEEYAV